VALVITLGSCNKKNDVIPDTYVNFTLDLNDPRFVDLSVFGGSVAVDSRTIISGTTAGYDGNGIIICYGVDEFYAYERTCPHDYVVNGLSIKISIDPKNSTIAICPKCGTKYGLTEGGTPASGVGRYPLKNYKTIQQGNYVTVRNCSGPLPKPLPRGRGFNNI
jgi:nitrite reductase/ring-hydroxylating ferredoxin subunit